MSDGDDGAVAEDGGAESCLKEGIGLDIDCGLMWEGEDPSQQSCAVTKEGGE